MSADDDQQSDLTDLPRARATSSSELEPGPEEESASTEAATRAGAEALLREMVREQAREFLAVVQAEDGGEVIQTLTMEVMRRSGPLPTAEEMARYREVSPDLPGRITSMAERALELRGRDRTGLRIVEIARISGALLTVLAVVGGGAWIGGNAGASVIGSTVVGLAAVFLGGKLIERRQVRAPDAGDDDD